MEFSPVGELGIGPFVFLSGASRNCEGFGLRTPVGGSRMYAPNISGLIERQSDQPVLVLNSERDAGGNARSNAPVAGQFVQPDRNPEIQRPRKAHPATLRVHHQRVAAFRELDSRIQAGDAKRNLGSDSSAAPSRVTRFCRLFHFGLVQDFTCGILDWLDSLGERNTKVIEFHKRREGRIRYLDGGRLYLN
jgi:hypothetical protein